MRRWLLPILLVLVFGALGFGVAYAFDSDDELGDESEGADYTLAVAWHGVGMPYLPVDPCAVVEDITGGLVGPSAFCLSPDGGSAGTQADGGALLALTAVGSPLTQTQRLCPNGPNCANATHQRLDGGSANYWKTASVASPAGDVTMCAVVNYDDSTFGTQTFPIARVSGGVDTIYLDKVGGAATARVIFYNGDGGVSLVSGTSSLANRAWHLVCGVYDYVADGTSLLTLYVDGASVGTPLSNVGGPPAAGNSVWTVGARSDFAASTHMPGAFRVAFITETALSAATITQLANSLLSNPTGPFGEPISYTNTTAHTREADDGTVTTLSPGRLPIVKGGVSSWVGATNPILRNEAIDNAAWTKGKANLSDAGVIATPVVTANAAICNPAPDGTMTADLIDFPAVEDLGATPTGYSMVYQDSTRTAAAWTDSLYVRAADVTDGGSLPLSFGVGGPNDPGNFTCDAGASWARCSHSATMTAAAWFVALGPDTRPSWVPTHPTSHPALSVCVWRAQAELGSIATPSIFTEASAVARNADQATVTFDGVTNNQTYSEDFTQWTATNTTVTPNTGIGPYGGSVNTADSVVNSAGSTTHRVARAATTVANAAHTMSVYAKPGTVNFLCMTDVAGNAATAVNVSTCTVTAGPGTAEAVGSTGYCRVSHPFTPTGTSATQLIYAADTQANVYSGTSCGVTWNPAGTETMYLWGAQVVTNGLNSQPLTRFGPGSYCMTGAAARKCDSTATNLILHSEDAGSAPWVASGGGLSATPTLTFSDGGAEFADPWGGTSAIKVALPNVTSDPDVSILYQTITRTAVLNTSSIYARTASGAATFYLWQNNAAGGAGSTLCLAPTTWNRCTNTRLLTAANYWTAIGGDMRTGTDQSAITASTIYIASADVTATPEVMPHIKTGATARWQHTRSGFGDNEGCIRYRISKSAVQGAADTVFATGTTSTGSIYFDTVLTAINIYDGTDSCEVTGLTGTTFDGVATWSATTGKMTHKVNGTAAGAGTCNYDGNLGLTGTLGIGARTGGTSNLNGVIRDVAFYPSQYSEGCHP